MRCRVFIAIMNLMLLFSSFAPAQKVIYSPFISDDFEIAGKSGDYYWIERREKPKISKKHTVLSPDKLTEKQIFDVYDSRMYMVTTTTPFPISDSVVKEYYVTNDSFFDQLVLFSGDRHTSLRINRYTGDGQQLTNGSLIFQFPFGEGGNSFLLIRSEDKSRLMVLCFQTGLPEGTKVHAVLFDDNWNMLAYRVYQHLYFSQPFIQDDFVSYPVEYFSSSPVKLTNDGDWLMLAPSRSNNNFLLFHFIPRTNNFLFREIGLHSIQNGKMSPCR
jgi:hypothetical protein